VLGCSVVYPPVRLNCITASCRESSGLSLYNLVRTPPFPPSSLLGSSSFKPVFFTNTPFNPLSLLLYVLSSCFTVLPFLYAFFSSSIKNVSSLLLLLYSLFHSSFHNFLIPSTTLLRCSPCIFSILSHSIFDTMNPRRFFNSYFLISFFPLSFFFSFSNPVAFPYLSSTGTFFIFSLSSSLLSL
jgi:hypothetical protein